MPFGGPTPSDYIILYFIELVVLYGMRNYHLMLEITVYGRNIRVCTSQRTGRL